jgi:hypothetical protein
MHERRLDGGMASLTWLPDGIVGQGAVFVELDLCGFLRTRFQFLRTDGNSLDLGFDFGLFLACASDSVQF